MKKILLGLIFSLVLVSSTLAWGDGNWVYYKNYTWTEGSGYDIHDYPVVTWLDHEGNANANCSDVRVVNNTGQNVTFGMRNCNSTHVELVYKIDMSASSTMNYSVYYGNPSATSFVNTSWDDNRYNVWDDFNDGSVNSNWFCQHSDSGTGCRCYTESSGHTCGMDDQFWIWNTSEGNFSSMNFTYRTRTTHVEGSNYGGMGIFRTQHCDAGGLDCPITSSGRTWGSWMNVPQSRLHLDYYNNQTKTSLVDVASQSYSLNTWYDFQVLDYPNDTLVVKDITNNVEVRTDNSTFSDWGYIGIGGKANGYPEADYVYASHFVDPEPAYLMGDEECISNLTNTQNYTDVCYNSTHSVDLMEYHDENGCVADYNDTIGYNPLTFDVYSHTNTTCLNTTRVTNYWWYNDSLGCGEVAYTINYTDCFVASCGDSNCSTSYQCSAGSCVADYTETQQSCCLDCGVPDEFYECKNNQLRDRATERTLTDIGAGTGGLFTGMGTPLTVFIIFLGLASAVGFMLASIGKGVGGNV